MTKTEMSPNARRLLGNAGGIVLISQKGLNKEHAALTYHLGRVGSSTESRCHMVRSGVRMHISFARKIAYECEECFR